MDTDGGEMILRATSVFKTYKEGAIEVHALRGVNLNIAAQKFTMIVGPSGSGKTTLLNLIGCLDHPTSGTVEIDGCDVAALRDRELTRFRARHIGFIFQSFNLIPVLSVFENVEYGLLLTKMPSRKRKQATVEMLKAVQLYDQRHQRPNQLSGGQKQRVAIARALVKRPSIVLADEPTANLDSETGARIVSLMRNLQAAARTTFIFSTHEPELMRQADELFTLRDGIISKSDTRSADGVRS